MIPANIKIRREGSKVALTVNDEAFAAGARLTADEAMAVGEMLLMLGGTAGSNSIADIEPEVLELEDV